MDIFIYGEIGLRDYAILGDGGDGMESSLTLDRIAYQLSQVDPTEPINLRINSMGGCVQTALGIYNILASWAGKVTAYIDGICLSAATVIACASDVCYSPKSSLWMIHNPQSLAFGDSNGMRKTAEVLDIHRDAVLSVYSQKTGKSTTALIAAMDSELWMTGSEAQKFGFVDEIGYAPQVESTPIPLEDRLIPLDMYRETISAHVLKVAASMGWTWADRGIIRARGVVAPPKPIETKPMPQPAPQPVAPERLALSAVEGSRRELDPVPEPDPVPKISTALNLKTKPYKQNEEEIPMTESLDMNPALIEMQGTIEKLTNKLATLEQQSRRSDMSSRYFAMRSEALALMQFDGKLTENEFNELFADDPVDEIEKLCRQEDMESEIDLAVRTRMIKNYANRNPLDRVSPQHAAKFQTSVMSKSVDGNPAAPLMTDTDDSLDSFLESFKTRTLKTY